LNPEEVATLVMSKKQRIVHIIDSLATGGAEILLKNTINILPEFDHTVVYLAQPDELRREFVTEVEFICLQHYSWRKVFTTLRRFRSIVKRREPLLIHAHLQKSTWIARLSNIKAPLISTLHSTYSVDSFAKNSFALWMEKITIGRQIALIGISRFVLEDYLKFVPFKGQSFVLYNFLEDGFFHTVSTKTGGAASIKLVAVGNLKEAKNYPYLLDILKFLEPGSFTLDIYGEGPLRKELQHKIETSALPVQIRGSCGDMKTILPQYDLFVQASVHEGFGLTVAEAMASKIPLAISDIPVFQEITGAKAHFLPLDNAEIAANIISKLIKNVDLRNLHVQEGFARVQSISNSKSYRKSLLSIYQSLTTFSL
jgi:glycosyltransferase involved in cell wall biosynthesis